MKDSKHKPMAAVDFKEQQPKANEQVISVNPRQKIVIFLGTNVPIDGHYCLNPFGSEELHPFITVDPQRFIFICAFSDGNANYYSEFPFTICKVNAQTHSREVFKNSETWPKQNREMHTFTIPLRTSIQFVDCNYWSKSQYKLITSRLVTYILARINKEFAPLTVIRIVCAHFDYVLGNDHLKLLEEKTVRSLIDQCLTSELSKIENAKSWKKMSRIICILAIKMSLGSKSEYFARDSELLKYYELIVNKHSNLGTTDDIITNLKRLLGEYVTYLQTKLTERIADYKNVIGRYECVLWFNLLHCTTKPNKQTNANKIRKLLKPTLRIDRLLTMAILDLKFVNKNRAIKMEEYFMISLLAVKSSEKKKWNARLKYDRFIRLLYELRYFPVLYSFLFTFKNGLRDLLGNDSRLWFGFVGHMITICNIPKGKLELSGAAMQSFQCMQLTSELFCHRLTAIVTKKDAAQLYGLCLDYPVIMDKSVRECILKNEYLISRTEFIALFVDLLRADSLTLKGCIAIWTKKMGLMRVIAIMKQFKLDLSCLKEYCVENKISTHIALGFHCDFAVITDNRLPADLRVIALSEKNKQWFDLTNTKSQINDNDETDEKTKDPFAFLMNNELEATHKNDSVVFIQIKRKELKVLQETEEKYRKSIVDLTNRLEDVNKSNEELRKTIQNGKKEATMMNDELHDTIRKFEEKNTLDSDEKEVDYSDKYIIIRELGSGNFGKVVFAKAKKTGKVVAIKIIKDIHNSFNAIHNEISIFKKCNKSKNIVSYIGSQYILESKEFWIVMEFCGGGSVKDMIKYNDKGIRESEIQTCLNDILRGLMYLHERCKPKIIHRDIKPDNILIDNYGVYKLSDFGTSKKMKSELTDTLKKGSPFYMAPEAVNTDEGGYSVMVDIWSVGITVYQMRTASFPQSYIEKKGTFELYLGGMFKNFIAPRLPTNFGHIQNSNEICDFVEKCLQTDPLKRLTAKQLLKHKFVSN